MRSLGKVLLVAVLSIPLIVGALTVVNLSNRVKLPYRNELKLMFLSSLPSSEYYWREKEVFERRGKVLSALIIVIPPFKFSDKEISYILSYTYSLRSEGLPVVTLWTLNDRIPGIVTYSNVLAARLGRTASRVYFSLSSPNVELIRPFLRRGIEIWVNQEGGSGWVKLNSSNGGDLKQALEKSLLGKCTKGYGSGCWRCDELYHGIIKLQDDIWWFYRRKSDGISGCVRYAPVETAACDIHLIRKAYFLGMGTGRILITLPGYDPASNCGGSCGVINTLWKGKCKYSMREGPSYIFASYLMTDTKADPCPYYSYCGCLGMCRTPQLFVSNVINTFPNTGTEGEYVGIGELISNEK